MTLLFVKSSLSSTRLISFINFLNETPPAILLPIVEPKNPIPFAVISEQKNGRGKILLWDRVSCGPVEFMGQKRVIPCDCATHLIIKKDRMLYIDAQISPHTTPLHLGDPKAHQNKSRPIM